MKRLLACLTLILCHAGAATAQAKFPELTTEYAVVSIFTGASLKSNTIKAVVSGTLRLESDTCGDQMPSVKTRFVVKQKGRDFTVLIPSRRLLRGKGGRGGFIASGRRIAENIPVFDEFTAGPSIKRSAKVRLSFTASFHGTNCQVIYSGVVGAPSKVIY